MCGCVGRAGKHVYEVFQYTEAVRFLKGDSSSTQTEGKSEKYGAPFKIKWREKTSTLHVTCTVMPERYCTSLTSHPLLTLPHVNIFSSFPVASPLHLNFNYFDTCFAVSPSISHRLLSPFILLHLYFYLSCKLSLSSSHLTSSCCMPLHISPLGAPAAKKKSQL